MNFTRIWNYLIYRQRHKSAPNIRKHRLDKGCRNRAAIKNSKGPYHDSKNSKNSLCEGETDITVHDEYVYVCFD